MSSVTIYNKTIQNDEACFFLAEIGNNHNGSVDQAKELIRLAAESGANGVKFQTFKAEDIVSPNIPPNAYPGYDVSKKFDRWIDFVKTLELDYDAYDELIELTHSLNMAFVSTPASLGAVDFLASKNIDALKIASMDLNNIPLLQKSAAAKIPIILSTGMSTYPEIEESVSHVKASPLIVLHCVSSYPLNPEQANLLNIQELRKRLSVSVGFSNHALGSELDLAAVAMGACLIEKHFSKNRKDPHIAEHHFSMEPAEYKSMVDKVRLIEKAKGSWERTFSADEETNRKMARRSVTAKRALQVGDIISEKDVLMIRPGTGIAPKAYKDVIGKKVIKAVEAYSPLKWSDLEESVS